MEHLAPSELCLPTTLAMGKPRKKRTAEEEAAYREARRAADRERCRLRRLDPVYVASERIKKRQRRLDPEKRQRRLDPEYAKRRREAEAARRRKQRQLAGLKARPAAGVPHPRLHRNQYTSCEKTVSKSTEANIVPKIHHVSTQIEHKVSTTPAHQRMCHSQSKVTKQHPLYCRGPRIATPGPVKVVEGASAYAKEAADKTTWCAGIYQTNMYSPTVSCWMQSHNLEDSDNIS
ncbi:uncharacterized protein LOC142769082 isoform X1 [Rhipicephalus microplus]|uniref:uncharacterized protein LOC142769082 isoform X1 n=1 Tax=Rhipicephalus microplus TaxID=6941 RepID=UPI003F6AC5B8